MSVERTSKPKLGHTASPSGTEFYNIPYSTAVEKKIKSAFDQNKYECHSHTLQKWRILNFNPCLVTKTGAERVYYLGFEARHIDSYLLRMMAVK